MAAIYGTIEEFDLRGRGDIVEYIERIDEYFVANDVDEDRKKTAIFLTLIGQETYKLLKNLLAPEKPNEKNYKELTDVLLGHLQPKPIFIAERYKFYQRKQETGESVAEFIATLRCLSEYYQFGAFLEEALRDRFVCGVCSPQ